MKSSSATPEYSWQRTTLWGMIQEDASPLASEVSGTLSAHMPDIQLILDKGGTAATDFTLHDGGHAFRVAERMCKIVPHDVLLQLTVYELAFLLLSAYLHDIGMTPELKKVEAHHSFLMTGVPQLLSEAERNEFQKWLDDDGRGITPPISREKITPKDLQICQEIITHYARARHNDWGAEWIKHNLGRSRLGQYKNWIDDIIKLCRSHHIGYNELKEPSFNPIVVNPDGMVVHLRYLASVLRVADILEFDPERTPSVIFRHRDVKPGSRIYWWKDHEVTLVQEQNKLSLHARPSDAPTEYAIRLMVESINSELQICRALDEQTYFQNCPTLGRKLPHRWDLLTTVSTNIVPKDGAYEYINGSFRPDTEKLLELLSGTALYGNPLMAVREMLQNSFDAVREKIAYSRLVQERPSDNEVASRLAELQIVSLKLEMDAEGLWLVCTDNGVGMTRSIIENHLLISGTGVRHEVLELERRCLKEGFPLGRTGQFGIGVLSYFMIADRLVVLTKRSQEPGDAEGIGWRFETAGVGSFGELKKQDNLLPGTQVRLHLREELVGQHPSEWFTSLSTFIKRTLRHIPCRFELSATLPGCSPLLITPGWCHGPADFESMLLGQIKRHQYREPSEVPLDLLSSVRRQEVEAAQKHIEIIKNEVKESLRWKVFEGDLPDGAGRVRIHVPYFHLLEKKSLAFLRIAKGDCDLGVEKIVHGYAFVPEGELQESWKGMTVVSRIGRHRLGGSVWKGDWLGTFVEVDWYSAIAGEIGINRTHMLTTDRLSKYSSWVMKEVKKARLDIMQSDKASVFTLLNGKLVGSDIAAGDQLNWLATEGEGRKRKWNALKFPLVPSNSFIFSSPQDKKLSWKRSKVNVSINIQRMHDEKLYDGITWYSNASPPDRIVMLEHLYSSTGKSSKSRRVLWHNSAVVPLWTTSPRFIPSSPRIGITSKFPPKWAALCGVKLVHYFGYEKVMHLWNPDHPVVSCLDSEGWDWCGNAFATSLDPIPVKNELLSDRSRASAWVIKCLIAEAYELWNGVKDRDQTFFHDLWKTIFPESKKLSTKENVICHWVEGISDSRLRILSSNGWQVSRYHEERGLAVIKRYLPDPGSEWKVIMHHPGEAIGLQSSRHSRSRST